MKEATSWKTSGAIAFLLEKGKATGNMPRGLLVIDMFYLQAVTKAVIKGNECLTHPEILKISLLSKPFKGAYWHYQKLLSAQFRRI